VLRPNLPATTEPMTPGKPFKSTESAIAIPPLT
jgi:hypothetical protein